MLAFVAAWLQELNNNEEEARSLQDIRNSLVLNASLEKYSWDLEDDENFSIKYASAGRLRLKMPHLPNPYSNPVGSQMSCFLKFSSRDFAFGIISPPETV